MSRFWDVGFHNATTLGSPTCPVERIAGRYYDFNVYSERKRMEKIGYMHHNPVHRGLAAEPSQWPWSSFRHFATGEIGGVEIESQWTATRRERSWLPTKTGALHLAFEMWGFVDMGYDGCILCGFREDHRVRETHVANGDLKEQTNRKYILGYFCKVIATKASV
jgi:hypothetical protein